MQQLSDTLCSRTDQHSVSKKGGTMVQRPVQPLSRYFQAAPGPLCRGPWHHDGLLWALELCFHIVLKHIDLMLTRHDDLLLVLDVCIHMVLQHLDLFLEQVYAIFGVLGICMHLAVKRMGI